MLSQTEDKLTRHDFLTLAKDEVSVLSQVEAAEKKEKNEAYQLFLADMEEDVLQDNRNRS